MPFIPVPNVAQIRIQGQIDGQLTLNDLYYEVSGGGITAINLGNLVNAIEAWATGSLALQLSEDWTYQRTVGFDLGSSTGIIVEQSNPSPGQVAAEAAPNNVAACVSLRTAQRGRSARGRNYVPGIPNNAITLNTLDNTFITNLLLSYNSLWGPGGTAAGWQQVIVSRYTGGAPRVTGLAIPVTNAIMVTPYVRSMRSREVGHGA